MIICPAFSYTKGDWFTYKSPDVSEPVPGLIRFYFGYVFTENGECFGVASEDNYMNEYLPQASISPSDFSIQIVISDSYSFPTSLLFDLVLFLHASNNLRKGIKYGKE